MWPGASVSGWYFSHPQSQYFVVGRLGRDQVADYAERKGWTLAEAERWLSPEPRLRPRGLSRGPPAAAVLWDMDGTLVDTEPYWIECEFELAEKHGGTWSRDALADLVGNDLLDSARYIREHMGIDLSRGRSSRSSSTGWCSGSRRRCRGDPGPSSCSPRPRTPACPCALVTMS